MAFDAVSSLKVTINRLLESSRISIVSTNREILEFALDGMSSACEFVGFLGMIRNSCESKSVKALEGEIREAARKLEDAIELHVSDKFLSQSETESQLSLDLQELRQDIDCFTQKMKKMHELFNPRFVVEEEAVTRDMLISWFATKAASVFLVMKEEFHKELENLLPEEEDEEIEEEKDQHGIAGDRLISWCATKAASTFLRMKEEFIKELENLLPEEDDDADLLRSRFFRGGRHRKVKDVLISWWVNKAASIFLMEQESIKELDNPPLPESSIMVGLTDLLCKIREELIADWIDWKHWKHWKDDDDDDESGGGGAWHRAASLVGMAGIGKTAIAKKIFEDPLVVREFECRIFVRIGPNYQFEKIMQAILAQVHPDGDKMLMEEHEKLDEYLRRTLEGRKVLIVLDDVWELKIWKDLMRILGYENTRSKVLMTTRLERVARSVAKYDIYKVPFLKNEESWDLLRGKIFAEDQCLPELEKVGKKIAENCEGLPLLILIVADLLSKAEKTPEYWSTVAADKTNSIFTDAYDQISEVLYPSYDYLPQYIKTCFLYMGVFPQNYEVRLSRLVNLWSVEGFLHVPRISLQDSVEECFKELVSNNVVLARQQSSTYCKPKACSLHSVFWHLCRREAWNDKFLHTINGCADATTEGIKSRRRLSIYKNIIFSMKEAYNPIASISTLRSLLCTGPHHQYQVPLCFNLRLLKVLDALTMRFYEFPVAILKLVHLRYLALTCNGNLPPSISKLWNLQCLVLHQYLSIKSTVAHSYLPMEIWDLQELEYLQIMGRNLPYPPQGAVLEKLLTLLDVGAHSCTKGILESIPNLQKLRVQIELAPEANELLSFIDDIPVLTQLASLQCVVVNPKLMSEIVASPLPLNVFAPCLTKLTLSGCGYPWKDMKKIAEVPFLEVLKLKSYAFRGEKWEAEEMVFSNLLYLSIEDTDLVHWTVEDKTFPNLFSLTIKNCYKLQEIPKILRVEEIQLLDCDPLAMTYAKLMAHDYPCFFVDSSWDDGSFKYEHQFFPKDVGFKELHLRRLGRA